MMKSAYTVVLDRLLQEGRLRRLQPLAQRDGCWVCRDGRPMLNLSSNDYLGLAGNRQFLERFYAEMDADQLLDRYALGAASSRLLCGDSEVLHQFERMLVDSYGAPAALFFNSGYHANIGLLPALFDRGDLIVSDKLNHASLHDGLRLATAAHKRYRHLDYAHLESILARYREAYQRVVIVSESVFSMDGDVADLVELVRLKDKYDCLLYLDEAHALGVHGPRGLGKAEEMGVVDRIDLLVGPLGKACASIGAFVLCTEEIREYLINSSRSLIFTTALPPVVVSWNLYVFKQLMTMARERDHLRRLAERLRGQLRRHHLKTAGETNIVPVIVGDNRLTVQAAAELQEDGLLILPVRPPTVPEGTARFRLSLSADMQWADLQMVAGKIADHLQALGPIGRAR
ncbi:MAG: aminotransferase class I/II-fold pyridoxal phosphate-dependent enzyme [Desulfopila sp.]